MISNVLARSAMRASTRQVVRSDLYHFSNSNGQVKKKKKSIKSHEKIESTNSGFILWKIQNIPFNTKNRAGLAIKMTLYLGLGFGAPFLGKLKACDTIFCNRMTFY